MSQSQLQDVRDYLSKSLRELADSDASAEEMARIIERAKATSQVSGAIVATVKVELDAIRTAERTGMLPAVVGTPKRIAIGVDK